MALMHIGVMLYIHIPFCRDKCDYCDFLSFAGREEFWEAYKDALVAEMARSRVADGISSVYIGGGTPTVLPPSFLREILARVREFNIAEDAEITCEANPETLTEEVLETLKAGGVNRLSVGLQSTFPHLLRAIGRGAAAPFLRAARRYFDNISVDLMFALPGQTMEDWRETLRIAADLDVRHISAYALTPEENTPLGERLRDSCGFSDRHGLPGQELDRRMYHYARDFLAGRGFGHYEISNFALPGFESRHNIGYWTRREYLGFGLGAHSFRAGRRFANTGDLAEYLNGIAPARDSAAFADIITDEEALYEYFILGLRLVKGVNLASCEEMFGGLPASYTDWVSRMKDEGLLETSLETSGEYLRLTRRGLDIANYVMAGFG